jgi:hypothetical protein
MLTAFAKRTAGATAPESESLMETHMVEATKKSSDEQFLLLDVRCSYLYVFKPYTGEDGKSSYTAHLIIPPDHKQLPDLKARMRKVATAAWGAETDEVLAQLTAQDRLCLHRGSVNKPGAAAYKDMLYVSANSKSKPNVYDRNRQQLTEAEGRPYSGCKINAIISIWAQKGGKWGRRINAELVGVQFWEDDERLSGAGKVAVADEFPLAADEADAPLPAASSSAGLI